MNIVSSINNVRNINISMTNISSTNNIMSCMYACIILILTF